MRIFIFLFDLIIPLAPWVSLFAPAWATVGRNLAVADGFFVLFQILLITPIALSEEARKKIIEAGIMKPEPILGGIWSAVTTIQIVSFSAAGWFWLAGVSVVGLFALSVARLGLKTDRKKLAAQAA